MVFAGEDIATEVATQRGFALPDFDSDTLDPNPE